MIASPLDGGVIANPVLAELLLPSPSSGSPATKNQARVNLQGIKLIIEPFGLKQHIIEELLKGDEIIW